MSPSATPKYDGKAILPGLLVVVRAFRHLTARRGGAPRAQDGERGQLTTLTEPPPLGAGERGLRLLGGLPRRAQNVSTNRSQKGRNTSSRGSSFAVREISSPIIRDLS